MDTTQLNQSKLGTREYWDEFYAVEQRNFEADAQDTGECWFDEDRAAERMVEFLEEHVGEWRIAPDAAVLDVGCGNGHLLFALADAGFHGRLEGVDYSERSVQLARAIGATHDADVGFHAADVFSAAWQPGVFDVVLDKGTLDAIALSGMQPAGAASVPAAYAAVVERVLAPGGVLLITSCNFTEDELVRLVEAGSGLRKCGRIAYPEFGFGGKKGSTICSVAFTKAM